MSVGFTGTLEGRGHTLTILSGTDTGYGIFGVLGNGAVVRNINIVNNSGRAPGWSANILFGVIATNARIENVTIEINNAVSAESTRYGMLTRDGLVNCLFVNTDFMINGNVQSLSGGTTSGGYGLKNTSFTDCIVSFIGETSLLGEVGHQASTVYVYKWANAESDKIV